MEWRDSLSHHAVSLGHLRAHQPAGAGGRPNFPLTAISCCRLALSAECWRAGCIAFRTDPIHNFRDFLDVDDRLGNAHWLVQHNGGVFLPPWGKAEQWTLSVQHTEDDARRFVDNFEAFARALRE